MAMGCAASVQRTDVKSNNDGHHNESSHQNIKETVSAALVRLDEEIANSEKTHPVERLAVVSAELESIRKEIKMFEEITPYTKTNEYWKTLHQMFLSLDIYRRPMLAIENEDFVAKVNRKEMRRIELNWLNNRYEELQKEKRVLHAQILRIRSLNAVLRQLLDSIWSNNFKMATPLEDSLKRARTLRDALASVSMRLLAAAEYIQAAARAMDDALPAWKLTTVAKIGSERTTACADACILFIEARCMERGARRVLAAYAAPRASRALRLALDYAFTDALHDQKYQKATETFLQFKEALVQLNSSIHQVLLNTTDNLAVAEREVEKNRKDLRTMRVNDIVKKGLADLIYNSELLRNLNNQRK